MPTIEITWSVSDKLGGKTEGVLPIFYFTFALTIASRARTWILASFSESKNQDY
jgi:hypothetical protein